MKILVAYDASDYAHAALVDLLRAGLPTKSEILVASVADQQAQATLTATEAVKLLSLERPAWDIRAEGLTGSPARALIEVADRWQPDLIVAGSHGRTAFGRFLLGSVSHKLVTEARCSVRIVRGGERPRVGPQKLLAGVDGSERSAAAVRAIAGRSWPPGTKVVVVAALDESRGGPEETDYHENAAMQFAELRARRKARAEELAASAVAVLQGRELAASTVVGRGSPKQFIVETADRLKVDCIFLGSSGVGETPEGLLGSAAAAVVMRASCPVEIVRERRPDRA